MGDKDRLGVSEARFQGASWERWVHEIRRIEFGSIMQQVPLDRSATVLELGCGDGFQLHLLRQRFEKVFAIDPKNRPVRAHGFSFSMAEALPFPGCTFDLVFSNCVVEHLHNRTRAIEEAIRVLRPGGYLAHVVPSRFWKAASLLLNPMGYPLRVAERWWALRQARSSSQPAESTDDRETPWPGILEVLGRWICPPVHGAYSSHSTEYRSYARERWREILIRPKLELVAEVPLLCYTQFGFLRFRLLPLRAWLGRHGLEGSRVFVLRKTG